MPLHTASSARAPHPFSVSSRPLLASTGLCANLYKVAWPTPHFIQPALPRWKPHTVGAAPRVPTQALRQGTSRDWECGAYLQSTRTSGRRVMGSLARTSPPHSVEETPSRPTSQGPTSSSPPPPVVILGRGDSDLPEGIPGTNANQSPLQGVCEYTRLWRDGGRQVHAGPSKLLGES